MRATPLPCGRSVATGDGWGRFGAGAAAMALRRLRVAFVRPAARTLRRRCRKNEAAAKCCRKNGAGRARGRAAQSEELFRKHRHHDAELSDVPPPPHPQRAGCEPAWR
eukprot:gene3277-13574_t